MVRPADPRDGDRIDSVVDAIWADDAVFRSRQAAYLEPSPGTAVLVVEVGGIVVGVGSLRSPRLHSHGLVHVDVHPAHQRCGAGTPIAGDLRRAVAVPLLGRARPWDPATLAFLAALGLVTAERVTEGIVDPADGPIAAWCREHGGAVRPVESESGRAAAAFLARWYERHHRWSPLRHPLDAEQAHRVFVESAVPGGLLAIGADEVVVGTASITSDPFGEADVAHLGHVAAPDAGGAAALIAAAVATAADRGWRVRFEVSDQDAATTAAMATFPSAGLYEGLVVLAEPLSGFASRPDLRARGRLA